MNNQDYILIVEDDTWLAEQYSRILQQAGFRTQHVVDVLAAMDALEAKLPAIIILDVLLIGPNAFTLLHELRSHDDLAMLPVVLCTNDVDSIGRADLRAYGVVDVLNKTTMTPVELLASMRRVLT